MCVCASVNPLLAKRSRTSFLSVKVAENIYFTHFSPLDKKRKKQVTSALLTSKVPPTTGPRRVCTRRNREKERKRGPTDESVIEQAYKRD